MRRKLINTCTCEFFIIFLMTQASLYDVLLVDQHATLEEIKLAFKKRALQVHHDKGGSKEAFHLVYEALETLADPEARQKYDSGIANISTTVQHPEDTGPRRKKTSMKHPTAQKEPRPEKAQKSKKRTAEGSNAETKPAEPKATQPEQTKLLIRIRDILKKLPRDVRSDVITKQFSQKQRLILEKWMVDMSSAQGGREGPLEIAVEGQVAAVQTLHSTSTTLPDSPCSALALPTSSASFSPKESKKQSAKQTTRNPKKEPTKTGSVGGYLIKSGGSRSRYIAGICFDAVEIHTKPCDFQTGLEYLVVLTAVKQKMRDPQTMHVCFEQRLQKALVSSAKEHRGDSEELKLDFCVIHSARFFMGAELRTPKVHTVEQLGKTRRLLEPFRKYQYAKGGGRRNNFWHYSPVHLQDAWGRFKKAVAEAWDLAGRDSSRVLQMMHSRHQAKTEYLDAKLQQWEQVHMAMQDKKKHQGRRVRERNRNGSAKLRWERRRMALEDKNKHRPRKFRVRLNLQKCPSQKLSRTLSELKRLLVRWECILKREARLLEQERQKALQQRKAQRKKDQEQRRRQEALTRKRLREEERLRQDLFRKRMRCDLTMDEILGRRHA